MSTYAPARSNGYTGLQIALHWIVALLILAAYLLSDGMGRLAHQKMDGTYEGGMPIHVILGLAVLAFAGIRLAVRLATGAPDAPEGSTETEAKARHWGHLALYVLMIGVPLGGVLVWYGGVEALGDVHGLAGNALLILAGLHAAVAIWHQWGKKDGTLSRMLKPDS